MTRDCFGVPVREPGETRANALFYPGLGYSRERRPLPLMVGDTNEVITSFSRLQMLNVARQLYANHGFIRGPVRDMTTYSVGNGLTPQSQTPSPRDALLLEDYFNQVFVPQADYSGEHDFYKLQEIASLATDIDGDIGFYMYAPRASDIGQLQTIEGHRIGGDEEGYVDGVRLDSFGRRIAYRILEGKERTPRDIDPSQFIFIYDPDRADARRGISALSHAIGSGHALDITDVISYEKVGVKANSGIAIAIKTGSGNADPGTSFIQNGFKASDTGGLPWDTFTAGMIPRLKPGEDIASFGSNRPSPAFMGFLAWLIRDISVGLGLPYEFVWDVVLAKGSGSRFILAKAQRRFEQRQKLLKTRFLTRVWRWVIAKGIKRGDIPPAKFWWLVNWQAPAKITVDLGREAQANRDDLKFGNRTLQIDAGEQGLHWKEDIREQQTTEIDDLLGRAVALTTKYQAQGLTLDRAISLFRGDSPNPPPLPVDQAAHAGDPGAPAKTE